MKTQGQCFIQDKTKWHRFKQIPFRESDVCVCGEMKIINGVVTKVEEK